MFDPENAGALRALLWEEFLPGDLDVDGAVLGLLENLGSPDPVLRDELSYSLLCRLLESGRVSPATVRLLLGRSIDDGHLFWRVGEAGTPTVFRRSFSVLMVPLVLEVPSARQALTDGLVHDAEVAVIRYAYMEQDRRGFVESQGWAHSAAHTADALGALGLDPAVDDVPRVLAALRHLATLSHPLSFLEDDRIAWAVKEVMRGGRVAPDTFQRWLDGFRRPAEEVDVGSGTIAGANAEHVLRSLYFRLRLWEGGASWLEPVFEAALRFDLFQESAPPPG